MKIVFCCLFLFMTYYSVSKPVKWEEIQSPEGGSLRVTVLDSSGSYWGYADNGYLYTKSANDDNWSQFETGIEHDRILDMFVTGNNDVIIYCNDKLIISVDQGNTWSEKSIPPGTSNIVLNFKDVLYSCSSGYLFRSKDYGDNWEKLTLPQAGPFNNLSVDVTPKYDFVNTSLMFFGHYFYYTKDFGDSWEVTDSLLGEKLKYFYGTEFYKKDGNIYTSVVINDSLLDKIIFVYISRDLGESWEPLVKIAPDSPQITTMTNIKIYPHEGKKLKITTGSRYSIETVYDDSFTIESYPTPTSPKLLKENEFPELTYDGIRALLFIDMLIAGNDLYVSTNGGLFRFDKSAGDWLAIPPAIDSGFTKFLGVTKSGGLLVHTKDDGFIKIYKDNQWVRTNKDSIRLNFSIYNNDILVICDGYTEYISFDYGSTLTKIAQTYKKENNLEYSLSDYYIGNNNTLFKAIRVSEQTGPNTWSIKNIILKKSIDSGKTWQESVNMADRFGGKQGGSLNICISPDNRLYLSKSSAMFQTFPLKVSYDEGATLTDCITGLDSNSYYSDMTFGSGGSLAILATSKGVYSSFDGTSWKDISPKSSEPVDLCIENDTTIYLIDYAGKLFKYNDVYVDVKENPDPMEEISVWPNPADEFIYMNVKNEFIEDINVKLISMTGNILFDKVYSSGNDNIRIDVSAYAPGVYILEMKSGNATGTAKIILK